MAYAYGYGGFFGVPYPILDSSPSPHPPSSAPPIQPFASYDPTQGGYDPMISHGSYHRSPANWSNHLSYVDNSRSQTPSSLFGDRLNDITLMLGKKSGSLIHSKNARQALSYVFAGLHSDKEKVTSIINGPCHTNS